MTSSRPSPQTSATSTKNPSGDQPPCGNPHNTWAARRSVPHHLGRSRRVAPPHARRSGYPASCRPDQRTDNGAMAQAPSPAASADLLPVQIVQIQDGPGVFVAPIVATGVRSIEISCSSESLRKRPATTCWHSPIGCRHNSGRRHLGSGDLHCRTAVATWHREGGRQNRHPGAGRADPA